MRKSANVTHVKYQCLYMMTVFNGLTQQGMADAINIHIMQVKRYKAGAASHHLRD